jgi:hypothetical protein
MAALNTSRARRGAEVAAVAMFIGLDIWIVSALAIDFMVLLMVAIPYLSICYLISEVIKLWHH